MGWFLIPALVLLVALVLLSEKAVRWKAAALCVLSLALSCWWLINRLSGDGLNAATLYHLQADMEGAGVGDFAGDIAGFIGLALLSLSALLLPRVRRFRLPAHGRVVLAAFAVTLVAAVAFSPLPKDGVRLARMLQPVDYRGVAQEYIRPEQRIRKPRNVVWVYGESLERTYMDPQAFPGLMPNLSRLAGQGLDVRDLGQAEGTGWTIAGMVASMCGVPLTAQAGDENSMGRMDRFLPDAACLGDVLRRQGYATRFIGGADSAFAGKGRFLRSHGFEQVRDLAWFRKQGLPKQHFSQWGVHDDVLLNEAWKSFETLSQASRDSKQGKPFLLTALTMDTHHPAGHLPASCKGQRYSGPQRGAMLDAIQCSDRLISALVDRIRASEYADDTLIVVSSDHLAMPNELGDDLAELQRENLLLFLGKDIAPRQLTASRASTLDTGATLLQLLEPSARAIGFGRSLLAPAPKAGASIAARAGSADYARYLAFARSLWTGGGAARALQLGPDARLAVGSQRIEPPVLLQYDDDWNLASITLEDTLGELARAPGDRALAYVQRCAAFEDDDLDGEWCALLVDRERGARLVGDAQLRRGVQVDIDQGRPARNGAQARTPVTVANRIEQPGSGQFLLDLWTGKRPDGPFRVEAVSEDGRVLASEWVQPDSAGRIRMPLALMQPEKVVRLRAWVDRGQHFSVGHHALMPVHPVAASRKTTLGSSSRDSRG